MNKRILIVNYYEISKLPPVRNLVEVLLRNGYLVTIITIDEQEKYMINDSNLRIIRIGIKNNFISKAIDFVQRKHYLRKLVANEMKKHDVLWTTTDRTARELGNVCKKYKHVMQLMELIEDMPLFPGQRLFKANLDKIGRSAYRVVVPEYNRAQILATWWDLKKIPYILPNKPASIDLNISIPKEYIDAIEKVKAEKGKLLFIKV